MAQTEENPEFFPSIADVVDKTSAGDEENVSARPMEEIESLCMQCGEQVRSQTFSLLVKLNIHIIQGVTRMMLTSIPFFREVIVMSFRCEHCGHSNNEIQSAGKIRRAHSFHLVTRTS